MPDRAAIVTGAARGIGFALADALGDQGYSLTVSARKPDTRPGRRGAARKGYEVEDVATNISPVAWPPDEVERFDDVVDADARCAPVAAARVMVRVIGAGLRAAPVEAGRAGARCSTAVVAMRWRSRGSGPLNSPTWSQTT
jgi:NAD(P)-dependent dehydrogenase (short-subunit alcohol dehydrogenase family)